jgi:hypothetical protein
MVLESNAYIMESLSKSYQSLMDEEGFPTAEKDLVSKNVKNFCSQLQELVYEIRMQVRRAKILAKTAADRKAIVSRHYSDYTGLFLKIISSSYKCYKRRQELVQNVLRSQCCEMGWPCAWLPLLPSSICLRPLYLYVIHLANWNGPKLTTDQTLFSTDIVKYQGDNGSFAQDSFSTLALYRWLQVALPLTCLSDTASGLWLELARKEQD